MKPHSAISTLNVNFCVKPCIRQFPPGEYSLYKILKAQNSVLLLPRSRYLRILRHISPQRPTYIVEKDFINYGEQTRDVQDKFYLNLHADLDEIKQVILPEVRPQKLILFGPYTKSYADELSSHVSSITTIFQNNQPALF